MIENFEDLVALDVRGECSPEQIVILESNTQAWLGILNDLKRDVEVQLAAQKARMSRKQAEFLVSENKIEWLNYKAQEQTWRVGAIRFMVSVESRMSHVKQIRSKEPMAA